jgi:nicotinate dehydrogenase subunit A
MQSNKSTTQLTVNGQKARLDHHPEEPLLYVLRNQLNINGPKYGCGLGQCGSCMVLVDGQPTLSCIVPAGSANGKEITTLAGLQNKDGSLHPVQQAFLDEQAAQCGYCTSGMILSSVALLQNNPQPSEEEIRQGLQINLCRCGTPAKSRSKLLKEQGRCDLSVLVIPCSVVKFFRTYL